MELPRVRLPRALLTALLLAAAAGALAADSPAPAPGPGTASVLEIDGAIGPATARYVVKGIEAAAASESRLVILQLDTPGGLDSAMRDIIRAILASPVPVVSYVSPSGARAASAGTYILYASAVAAMAPATNLGAATPVSISGGDAEPAPPAPPAPPANPPGSGGAPAAEPKADAPGGAMQHKVVNDAVAYIRGLAELRGRNAEWAEAAVRGAASLSAQAALEQKVIDLIARDLPDLLKRLDGREVQVNGHPVKLATSGLQVVHERPDWRTQLLAVITNPTVAYGLMLIGIWGLLLEGYNPGAVLPGVAGSICLLIALFAFQILSVNYAGLALVVVGVGMIVAEFFYPTYGSLGIGGLIAFVVGSLILFDSDVPGMRVGRPLIAAFATVGALVMVSIVFVATRSLRRPVATGVQGMLGAPAEVVGEFPGRGRVRYGGELWSARSEAVLHAGDMARIVRVEGLTLWIEPE
ncbi:MAG: nodulation protein NfeD [Proteobacteria bacterium]|nr:nodulation protein NfeD [Pseudomonadota bacterium]